MEKHFWLVYVLGAILMWGAYVVTIDRGRSEFGKGPVAAMRAFLFIGVAYFVMGVLVPVAYLVKFGPSPVTDGFPAKAVIISTIAGILGAGGALCIVFAVGKARAVGGEAPLWVAPLVFGFAPIVNCIVALAVDGFKKVPPWPFFLGIALAAVGAGLVLFFKPEPDPVKPAAGGAPVPASPTTRPATEPTPPQ